jgi:hypothetical protein
MYKYLTPIALSLIPTSAIAQQTQFNATFARPDGKNSYSINQSVKFDNFTVRAGLIIFTDNQGDRTVVPFRLSSSIPIDNLRITVSAGADQVFAGATNPAGSVGVEYKAGDLRIGAIAESVAILDNPRTIDKGIRTINLSPSLNWQIDKQTNISARYTIGFFSDSNTQQTINIRLNRELGNGLYVAPNYFKYSVRSQLGNGYWETPSYAIAGLEVGMKAPLSKNLGVQAGLQPSLIMEEGKETRFGIGGGAGVQWVEKQNTLQLWVRGGYGVSIGGSWQIRF